MRIEQVLKKSVVNCFVEIVLINNPKIIMYLVSQLNVIVSAGCFGFMNWHIAARNSRSI